MGRIFRKMASKAKGGGATGVGSKLSRDSNPTKSLMFLESKMAVPRRKPKPVPERRRKRVQRGGSQHKALQTLANIGSDEIASELESNPLAMDDEEGMESEDSEEEGVERGAPTPLFGS